MTVSAGALPEGFCPQSIQDMFDAMVQRIIVTPNQVFTSFAMGALEPTSNVGPWLKNCESWFVWDDTTSRYIPMIFQGGFQKFQVFDANGTFMVPDFIYSIRAEAWGGGGGGANEFSGSSESGGGGGGYGFVQKAVIPGQSISVVVGAGGSGGAAGSNGADSTVSGMTAGGGKGAVVNPSPKAGKGGVVTGADISIEGGPGKLTISGGGGAGGDAPKGGQGGRVDSALGTQQNGILPGGGGAGGTISNNVGGNGANGKVIIYY